MMNPRELAQAALAIHRQLEKFEPYDRQEVLHITASIVQVEVARLNRPQPVKDE